MNNRHWVGPHQRNKMVQESLEKVPQMGAITVFLPRNGPYRNRTKWTAMDIEELQKKVIEIREARDKLQGRSKRSEIRAGEITLLR